MPDFIDILRHIEERQLSIVPDGDPDLNLQGYAVANGSSVVTSGPDIESALDEYAEKHMQ